MRIGRRSRGIGGRAARIGLAAAFGLCAWCRGAEALSASKLGPHMLDNSADPGAQTLLAACPRVAKWLDDGGAAGAMRSYKARCPGGVTVLRVYVPSSVHYDVGRDPKEAADDYWARISGELSAFPSSSVDWLEGPNELDNLPDWYHNGDAAQWFARFWDRLADTMHSHGYNPLVGSIAVGNPALGGELGFGPRGAMGPLADVIRSKAYRIGWSYHSYEDDLGDARQMRYWALRYRLISNQAGLAGVPLVLTEGGQDGPRHGWRGRTDPEAYIAYLSGLDMELRKDDDVVGVTLFQVGNHSDWASFDLGPVADALATLIRGSAAAAANAGGSRPAPGGAPSDAGGSASAGGADVPVPSANDAAAILANPGRAGGIACSIALADVKAADGQSLKSQPASVQQSFCATWLPKGVDPATEWAQEHNKAIGAPGAVVASGSTAAGTVSGGSPGGASTVALDGQMLASQPANVQKMFRDTYGAAAAAVWAAQHNAEISQRH